MGGQAMQTHKIMPKEGTLNSRIEFSKQNVEKIKEKNKRKKLSGES